MMPLLKLLLLDNQPIGRLYVHRRPSEICIMDIALLPAYCNQGLGSFLINSIFHLRLIFVKVC